MPEVTPVSPEQLRNVPAFARPFVAAEGRGAPCPPEHHGVRPHPARLASTLLREVAGPPHAPANTALLAQRSQ